MRAELRRLMPVAAAARELHAAMCSGDTGRITVAMHSFAVLDASVRIGRRNYYHPALKESVVSMALRVGPTRAARLTEIPFSTITRWLYGAKATLANPRLTPSRRGKKQSAPPGRASPAKRAKAILSELYRSASP